MMKCKKGLVAGVVAVCMMGAMGVNAFADTTVKGDATEKANELSTNVKYAVTKEYTWSIHSDIDFGSNEGINATVEKEGNTVSVSKNVIAEGEELQITVKGSGTDGAFIITNNESQILSYDVNSDEDNKIVPNAPILTLAAGNNSGSANMKFTLHTTTETAEVAGDYTGTLTYTASIIAPSTGE